MNFPCDVPEKFWAKVNKTDGCWLWTGSLGGSSKEGESYGRYGGMNAHRWLWQALHGPLPKEIFVCHKCDVRLCVNPDHLFPGTHKDNMHDRSVKGRHKHQTYTGTAHPAARLTEEDVRFIRQWKREGKMIKDLVPIFGVDRSTIGYAASGKSWSHLEDSNGE